MKPLLNEINATPPPTCDHCGGNPELPHYQITSPDGRLVVEQVVCEVCVYDMLTPWYPAQD